MRLEGETATCILDWKGLIRKKLCGMKNRNFKPILNSIIKLLIILHRLVGLLQLPCLLVHYIKLHR